MKFYNTKDNPEFIERVVEHCVQRSSWEYGYDADWYKDLSEDINKTTVYFVYDEKRDQIVSILTSYERFGKKVWHVGCNEDVVAEVLKSEFPDGFFVSGNGHYFKEAGLYATECKASYNHCIAYPAIANAGLWTSNPEFVNSIRDWLEAKYLNPVENWQDLIQYKWVDVNEFSGLLYDNEMIDFPWHRTENGHYAYIGFHYMNWEYNNDHTWYLLAMVNDTPIGCICIQKFELYGYYGVSYIDVAFPYKNKGVAKKMIHELTKIVPGDLPLLLSMESEEGQKCHMHECFKRETWPNACVTQEEFDEMCRKKAHR